MCAAADRGSGKKLVYSLSGVDQVLVRTILAYEGEARGLSQGQAAYELVMAAVDLESYPEEVRRKVAGLEEESSRAAVARALKRAAGDAG